MKATNESHKSLFKEPQQPREPQIGIQHRYNFFSDSGNVDTS